MITRPVSSLYTKPELSLKARVHGPWPLPCLARYSNQAKQRQKCPGGVPAQARATWNEVGSCRGNGGYVTLLLKSPAGAPCCWFCFVGKISHRPCVLHFQFVQHPEADDTAPGMFDVLLCRWCELLIFVTCTGRASGGLACKRSRDGKDTRDM